MLAEHHIQTLISSVSAQYPNNTALEDPYGSTLTFEALSLEVADIQNALAHSGVRHDSRVAIVLPNGLGLAVALIATVGSATAVPLNPLYKKFECIAYFDEIRITHLLITQGLACAARDVALERNIPILELTPERKLLGTESVTSSSNERPRSPADVALILLTSGSTGRPKKVPLTHQNICVSVEQICDTLKLTSHDRCLCMWEQFHIGGLVDLLLAPLARGGSVICTSGFNTEAFFRLQKSHSPTWFQGVPTSLYALLVHARSHGTGYSGSLRFIRSVASALNPSLMQELEETFKTPVIQTFGMTEASPLITTNRLPPDIRKPGSVGKSCGPDIRIENPNGKKLIAGEIGEVVIRGDNVFSGYEDAAEANATSFSKGWFRTGDTGFLDEEGYLFLRGRLKEMINRGGEKVTPQEVDDVLLACPGIAQAATFSISHPTLGEDVGAAVVLEPGAQLSEKEIRDFASSYLSAFKIPRRIMILEKMPVDAVGKINRLNLSIMAVGQGLGVAKKENFVPPSSKLEETLARLWAEELDIPEVGIDDDFIEIGGDSLSSIRLLTAIEVLLGISVADDDMAQLTSVRKMARHIMGMGHAESVAKQQALVSNSPQSADIHAALVAAAIRDEPADGDLRKIRQHLVGSLSSQDFNTRKESLFNLMTPKELATVFSRDPDAQEHLELTDEFKKLHREIAAFPDAAKWSRHAINKNVHHYSTTLSAPKPKQKILIVGFCGRAMRLMIPIFRFLIHLDADQYDLLLLRNLSRDHYANGIQGICEDLGSLAAWLDSLTRDMGYTRRISFGTSSGGLAALGVGIANGWQKSIVVGADAPSKHPRLDAFLKSASRNQSQQTGPRVVLLHAALNERDYAATLEIKLTLPSANRLGIASLKEHNVLDGAHRKGVLKNLFGKLFQI